MTADSAGTRRVHGSRAVYTYTATPSICLIKAVAPADPAAFFEGFCPNCHVPLAGDCRNWCPECRAFWNAAS